MEERSTGDLPNIFETASDFVGFFGTGSNIFSLGRLNNRTTAACFSMIACGGLLGDQRRHVHSTAPLLDGWSPDRQTKANGTQEADDGAQR
jgi:hypothetical protein